MMNLTLDNDPRLSAFIEFKSHIDVASEAIDGDHSQFLAKLQLLQFIFQSQVQILTWEDWPAQRRSLLQSIRVEMHKQLRLLTTDLLFFKAAKQAETRLQRQGDIRDRLTHLQGYCDAIMKLAQETRDGEPNSSETGLPEPTV